MICNKCKKQIADDSIVCRFCGEKVCDDPDKSGCGLDSNQNKKANNNQGMYKQKKAKRKSSKASIIIIAIICVLVIGIGACFAAMGLMWASDDTANNYKDREETVRDKDKDEKENEEEKEDEKEEEEAAQELVLEKKYACLLTVPDSTGRADMIMLAVINTENEAISILSIPKDTIVNGENVKISEIALRKGKQNMKGLTDAVEDLTGIKADSYVQVDIECVKDTVDLFGGVEFYVPQRMNYSDPYQNLKIDLQRGMQTLDGDEAQQLLRFRNYTAGDIRRTQTQREFLVEAFKQHAKIENIGKIKRWFNMAKGHIKTNMSANDVTEIASAAFENSYQVKTDVIPYEVFQYGGNTYVYCDEELMAEMAEELGY